MTEDDQATIDDIEPGMWITLSRSFQDADGTVIDALTPLVVLSVTSAETKSNGPKGAMAVTAREPKQGSLVAVMDFAVDQVLIETLKPTSDIICDVLRYHAAIPPSNANAIAIAEALHERLNLNPYMTKVEWFQVQRPNY